MAFSDHQRAQQEQLLETIDRAIALLSKNLHRPDPLEEFFGFVGLLIIGFPLAVILAVTLVKAMIWMGL